MDNSILVFSIMFLFWAKQSFGLDKYFEIFSFYNYGMAQQFNAKNGPFQCWWIFYVHSPLN